MLSISVLRVVEHVGSDAFQVKAWRKCSSGEYSSRIVAVWQGILQNTADDEMRRMQQCDTWRAIRPAARTVGLCTLAFSLVFSVACGMEQLLLAPLRGFPYALWDLLLHPSVELAKRLLTSPSCSWCEFTRQFFRKLDTPEKLISPIARSILSCLAIFIRMEIRRIECRNALIKRLTCMYGPGWSNSLANVSAICLMLRSRILEGLFPVAAKRYEKPCAAKPRKRLRRQKKKNNKVSYDQRAGGGGAQRAFLSTWLRERKSAAGLTKKQRKKARSDLFTAGNKAYQDCLFRGGVEVERLKCVGAAGAQACSAGAAAFGGLKK